MPLVCPSGALAARSRIALLLAVLAAVLLLPALPARAHGTHLDRAPMLQRDLGPAPAPPRGHGRLAARARAAAMPPAWWCGRKRRSDDRADDVFGGAPTVKPIYALPK